MRIEMLLAVVFLCLSVAGGLWWRSEVRRIDRDMELARARVAACRRTLQEEESKKLRVETEVAEARRMLLSVEEEISLAEKRLKVAVSRQRAAQM